jgi:hypothetical protein
VGEDALISGGLKMGCGLFADTLWDTDVEKTVTLLPGAWYAVELIGEEFGDELRHYTPIRVDSFTPVRREKGVMKLEFYHAAYPEGVCDKLYKIRIIEQNKEFLLAKTNHTPPRFMLVSPIRREWLKEHFGIDVPRHQSLVYWLNENA